MSRSSQVSVIETVSRNHTTGYEDIQLRQREYSVIPLSTPKSNGHSSSSLVPNITNTNVGAGIGTGTTQPGSGPGNSNSLLLQELGLGLDTNDDNGQDQETKLPPLKSLITVIAGNALFQTSFFIIVSSASAYAEHLGGSAVFSGLTIGIPTLFSGIALFFIAKYDRGGYVRPYQFSYAAMILGNILYGLAYTADFLYLILIGRIVTGFGFISFMYSKRYCSDPRIVGIRKRTMLASWLVLGQGFGFSAGPFLGGVLYKVGFGNNIFNGFTSPGWVMVGVWIVFWVVSTFTLKEVVEEKQEIPLRDVPNGQRTAAPAETSTPQQTQVQETVSFRDLDKRQWGVIICMCYYAMTCFFILASWEANIPIFSAAALGYSPYQAGNFIALGGVATLPFLLANIRLARHVQDRVTLATGSLLGLSGLFIMLAILREDRVSFGAYYVCWFLIALGFNLASTCTLSLLSKQLPNSWNSKISMAIQYSNYTGRVTGAVLGGAGVDIGMVNYICIQIGVVCIGGVMHVTLWREMKAKRG